MVLLCPLEPPAPVVLAGLFRASLRNLPRRQRDCVVLRYYLDLSVDEIADTLGVSRNSVKTHLTRGLKNLSTDLGGADRSLGPLAEGDVAPIKSGARILGV